MFTPAATAVPTALSGARMRVSAANPAVTITSAWYATAVDACTGFDHKHPARRPPSLT